MNLRVIALLIILSLVTIRDKPAEQSIQVMKSSSVISDKPQKAKIKRVNLKKDYDEEDRYRIYLKADKSDKLVYAIVKEEKDIEIKKFVEEGEVTLN